MEQLNVTQPENNLSETTATGKEAENDLVFSYMTLRNLIGFSGMLLPFILLIFSHRDEKDEHFGASISDYYFTNTGDVLVVLLSVLGVFLFTYKGYSTMERILTCIAAVCGVGVAFFPTASQETQYSETIHSLKPDSDHITHFAFAGLFFVSLSIISLKFFRKTHPGKRKEDMTEQKRKRNIVYNICGWTMLGCVAGIALYLWLDPSKSIFGKLPVTFILESIAVEAFAISWLTKGETLWPDGKHYIIRGYEKVKNKKVANEKQLELFNEN